MSSCPTNHGSMIRGIIDDLTFSWINIHRGLGDGETQADRFRWCILELSVSDESRLAHFAVYHWDELLAKLPQDLRYGFREFAREMDWTSSDARYTFTRAPWVI
jgi:hypothetical protein